MTDVDFDRQNITNRMVVFLFDYIIMKPDKSFHFNFI